MGNRATILFAKKRLDPVYNDAGNFIGTEQTIVVEPFTINLHYYGGPESVHGFIREAARRKGDDVDTMPQRLLQVITEYLDALGSRELNGSEYWQGSAPMLGHLDEVDRETVTRAVLKAHPGDNGVYLVMFEESGRRFEVHRYKDRHGLNYRDIDDFRNVLLKPMNPIRQDREEHRGTGYAYYRRNHVRNMLLTLSDAARSAAIAYHESDEEARATERLEAALDEERGKPA